MVTAFELSEKQSAFYAFLDVLTRATCPAHISVLEVITITILGKEYKL
jgi:hypothetical protein